MKNDNNKKTVKKIDQPKGKSQNFSKINKIEIERNEAKCERETKNMKRQMG